MGFPLATGEFDGGHNVGLLGCESELSAQAGDEGA